jgi:hypothetical protein
MYFNPILKEDFGYSPEDIIGRNFFLSIILVVSFIFWVFLSSRIHPIKILKMRGIFFLFLMIVMPFLIITMHSSAGLFFIQALILLIPLDGMPADAVLFYHFPIFRRFTFVSFLYAVARAFMYTITSFGLVYLGSYFGSFGLWFITLPIAVSYLYGVRHFEGLERKLEIYPHLIRKAA